MQFSFNSHLGNVRSAMGEQLSFVTETVKRDRAQGGPQYCDSRSRGASWDARPTTGSMPCRSLQVLQFDRTGILKTRTAAVSYVLKFPIVAPRFINGEAGLECILYYLPVGNAHL